MTTNDPCALLENLLLEPEQEWIEFKANRFSAKEAGEYVSALANSAILKERDKAYLVYGIEDGSNRKIGTTIKLRNKKADGQNFVQWLQQKLSPRLMIEFLDFDCDGLRFAIMCIEPTYEKPVAFDGIAYIRIGENKRKLKDFPQYERALWLATGRRKFEQAIALSNVTAEDLLEKLDVQTYYTLSGEEMPEARQEWIRKLETLGAVNRNMEGKYDILNLAAILFAKNIDDFPSIKGKSVRVVKYVGTDKQQTDFEQEGKYGYAVGFRGLIKFVMASCIREVYLDGVRKKAPIIPEQAVREIIANALIHQDFTQSGTGPMVEIYSDRIEVVNPGNSLIETDRMIDERKSRNHALADLIRLLGLCEERGGGLDKAIIAIEFSQLPAPDFIPSKDSMRIVMFGPRPFKKMSKAEKERACFFHCVIKWLKHDYMSNASLRQRFGLSQEDYQAASAIISAAVKAGRILPADPAQGKKSARYVPYWVR